MSKNVGIEPVQRAQLPEQVIEHIKKYIEANNLLSGAKLPSERDLAKSLGVSRNITREALRTLQATGILDIRPGNGAFVAEFGFEALANHFNFGIRHQQHQMRHLIEARLLFENGINVGFADGHVKWLKSEIVLDEARKCPSNADFGNPRVGDIRL